MAYLISFAGPDQPEKLQFMRALAQSLASAGLRAGLLLPGQAAQSPAYSELTVDQGRVTLTRPEPGELSAEILVARYLDEMDLVLSALPQDGQGDKIEFVPADAEPRLLEDAGLKALVSPQKNDDWLRMFALDQADELASFIREEMLPNRPPDWVRVTIDGEILPIKDFVQDITANTVKGLIGSLKGGDQPGRLVVVID